MSRKIHDLVDYDEAYQAYMKIGIRGLFQAKLGYAGILQVVTFVTTSGYKFPVVGLAVAAAASVTCTNLSIPAYCILMHIDHDHLCRRTDLMEWNLNIIRNEIM